MNIVLRKPIVCKRISDTVDAVVSYTNSEDDEELKDNSRLDLEALIEFAFSAARPSQWLHRE